MEYSNGVWLNLMQSDEKLNEKFARGLYDLDDPHKEIWFDKLDCSEAWHRQTQKGMTLDNFLSLRDNGFKTDCLKLVLGRSEGIGPNMKFMPAISYAWILGNSGVDYFYWFRSEFISSINQVSEIFKNSYNQGIWGYPRIN